MEQPLNDLIFLDIDGVLINIFPPWNPDEVDEDGYSKFNAALTANLKALLDFKPDLRIVVSSSRRIGKSLSLLEDIFAFRGIKGKVADKTPDPGEVHLSRAQEVSRYIEENGVKHFLIIDDDQSLLQLPEKHKQGLILTRYRDGFDKACLSEAIAKVKAWEND